MQPCDIVGSLDRDHKFLRGTVPTPDKSTIALNHCLVKAIATVLASARLAHRAGAKALWCQYNVISPEGGAIAEAAGPKVVMDRCMKVEHARHLGRMHWLGFNTGIVTARRGT